MLAHPCVSRNITLNYFYAGLMSLKLDWTVWMLFLGHRGIGLAEIGLIESVSQFSSLVSGMSAGVVSDMMGRRVSAVCGILTRTAGFFLILIGSDFVLFAFGFALHALSQLFFNATYESMTFDTCKIIEREHDYKRILSNMIAVMFTASALGATASGFVAEWSIDQVYVISIVISMMGLIPALLFVETTSLLKARERRMGIREHFIHAFVVIRSDGFVATMLAMGVTILIVDNAVYMYLQRYFHEMGVPISLLGILFAVDQALVAAGAKLSFVLDRFRLKDVIMAVPLMMLVSYALLAMIDHVVSCVFLFLVAVLLAMFYPTQSEIMNRRIPVESRGTLQAFKGQLMSLGIMIVFPLMGWIAEKSSLSAAFLMLIALALPILFYLTLSLRAMELLGDVPAGELVGMSR